MKTIREIKELAVKAIENEIGAIEGLKKSIDNDFVNCVQLILKAEGRVIISGIGKSAIIANKIVSTLNSTGTPSIFMHAVDAIHGDMGTIKDDDIIICISKSGETSEMKLLISLIRDRGNPIIAMVGNSISFLARNATYVLDTSIEKEACLNNLIPTASTTAQLVMGDVLALCLFECRESTIADIAKYHPGGILGKTLMMKVADLSLYNNKPRVHVDNSIEEVILDISKNRLGATVVFEKNELRGIITDSDLEKVLQEGKTFSGLSVIDIMTVNPITIESNCLVVDALGLMKKNNISHLPVLNNKKYIGIIHIHDILNEGLI